MPDQRISAVIMTLNEEHNIEFCLRSVRPWCNEVIVVDMKSEDQTVEIARRYADTVLEHDRIEGFDAGRGKGFTTASGDWVLSIDADEVVTPELAAWIRAFVAADPPYDVGRWLKSSPYWPGKPRLFRRGKLEVSGTLHHGLMPVRGARIKKLPKQANLSMWHFAYPSIESLTAKTNRYTSIEARQALDAGRGDPSLVELLWAPMRAVLVYFAKLGPRDGMAGLVWTVDRAYYRFMSAAKRWDEARLPTRQQEYDEMREKIVARFSDAGAGGVEHANDAASASS
jgi:glycosyltransferase involved in cell wall biosynthesis